LSSQTLGAGQFCGEHLYTSGAGPLSMTSPPSVTSQRPLMHAPLPQSDPSSTTPLQSSSTPSHASSDAWHVAHEAAAVQ
jgi:hypothetical protein